LLSNHTAVQQRKAEADEREHIGQVAILIGAMGLMLVLIGFFPSITGVEPKSGVGVLQILIIILGLALLIIAALVFVKVSFYPESQRNLAQDIAIRLSLTGLLMSGAAGLADVLGFGSHSPGVEENLPYLGPWQAAGIAIGFAVASLGVLIFAWAFGESG
jgi:protein-S-isoprenylcysteine O-methyltransferase Ste14